MHRTGNKRCTKKLWRSHGIEAAGFVIVIVFAGEELPHGQILNHMVHVLTNNSKWSIPEG
jgi:hypothetical protein